MRRHEKKPCCELCGKELKAPRPKASHHFCGHCWELNGKSPKRIMMVLRVKTALSHARKMLELYKSIPTGSIGAALIQRDIEAVEQGDHSEVAIKRLEDIS